ncbi:hypothetical protein BGW38_004274 [Lunasporangiospora selenospora]|uniref:Uncharacterized protein n=1 Tax=Lunasporangiospora selenospora TaxID=979761 RepID=A0A9P6FRI5_9FUNG|nr:hypothetical protein BGW38_004274 [Lunasporangiospora selenospora]
MVIICLLIDPIQYNWDDFVAIQFTASIAVFSFFTCELLAPKKVYTNAGLFFRCFFLFIVLTHDFIRSGTQLTSWEADKRICELTLERASIEEKMRVLRRTNDCRFYLGLCGVSIVRGLLLITEIKIVIRHAKVVEPVLAMRAQAIRMEATPSQRQPPAQNTSPSPSVVLSMEGVQVQEQSPTPEDRSQIGSESMPDRDSTLNAPHEEPPAYWISDSGTEIEIDMTNVSSTDHPTEQTPPSSATPERENESVEARA